MYLIPRAESGCSDSAERLPHSELKPAGGCDWTGGSWKGQLPTDDISQDSEGSLL